MTATVTSNKTRIRLHLPARDVDRALEHAVRTAIGDPDAKVSWGCADEDGDDVFIVVRQAHATWWTYMPEAISELFGEYVGSFTLKWREGNPPESTS